MQKFAADGNTEFLGLNCSSGYRRIFFVSGLFSLWHADCILCS